MVNWIKSRFPVRLFGDQKPVADIKIHFLSKFQPIMETRLTGSRTYNPVFGQGDEVT
jgi:hypothetical protein